jgi:CRISPR/Cas system-associated exonuclease Cas4 (RecB family)
VNETRLLSISDLCRLGPDVIRKLDGWNPAREIMDWSVERANTGEYPMLVRWNPQRRHSVMHATSFNTSCDRFLQLELLGHIPQNQFKGPLRLLLDTGQAIGIQLGYYYETLGQARGFDVDLEYDIYKHSAEARRLRIGGRTDTLVHQRRIQISPQETVLLRYLLDYKGLNAASFGRLRKAQAPYVRQLMIYMALTDTPIGVLLYMNKDTSRLDHRILAYDDTLWKTVENRAMLILDQTRHNKVVSHQEQGRCRSCGMRSACLGGKSHRSLVPIIRS